MQNFNAQLLFDRMMGAARLDVTTYEDVERDQNATVQALIVVTLAAIAAGIGTLIRTAAPGSSPAWSAASSDGPSTQSRPT